MNCPFDEDYAPLRIAILFTILDCGFNPRIASERLDSGEVRLQKIRRLIRASRFSIHDLSRIDPQRHGDPPRYNMPFELGLDLGCRFYGARKAREKRWLVLEAQRYRYQAVLSDIAGNDIAAHEGQPQLASVRVRDWLKTQTRRQVRGTPNIWSRLSLFLGHLRMTLVHGGYPAGAFEALQVPEFIEHARDWIGRNPSQG